MSLQLFSPSSLITITPVNIVEGELKNKGTPQEITLQELADYVAEIGTASETPTPPAENFAEQDPPAIDPVTP